MRRMGWVETSSSDHQRFIIVTDINTTRTHIHILTHTRTHTLITFIFTQCKPVVAKDSNINSRHQTRNMVCCLNMHCGLEATIHILAKNMALTVPF